MTKTNDLKMQRIAALLVLATAALLVLSALSAPDAQAKKKRHHHRASAPSINTVQCPNQSDGFSCVGTASADYLVGRDNDFDNIEGGEEGDDVYDGKGGGDNWIDRSTTSNDYYLVSVENFGDPVSLFSLLIEDAGGSQDTLDLSRFYKSSDFAYGRAISNEDLLMDGAGANDVLIKKFFTTNSIDFFKFSDGTFTADQIKSKVK